MSTSVRSRKPLLLLAAAAATLLACGATIGRQYDTTHVHDVKQGEAKAQITSWFGDPTTTTTMTATAKGCVERWKYTYAHASGGTAHAQVLIVDFDPNGAVCDTAYSESTQ
jgi:outer membrane protein assembly factor BamE (lipoprotein component of BamABCDE complex)